MTETDDHIMDSLLNYKSAVSPKVQPTPASKGNYAFVSLGCPKNLVDSERMLGLLQLDGYKLVARARRGRLRGRQHLRLHRARAHGIVCRDRRNARAEAQRRIRGVIVSGCLAEREKE